MYSIQQIADITGGRLLGKDSQADIEHLVYDSRRIQFAGAALFFALVTKHNDGHRFVHDAYKKGIRNFVVQFEIDGIDGASQLIVENSLDALQDLAAFHRSRFTYPVIGITGSNGKTVVKEWLYQVLQDEHNIVRSPKSFNSQLGAALSVWQMKPNHTLAIFEAGISEPGEMKNLEKMIRPGIGVLTNIGSAHDDGFLNDHRLKLEEKLLLFKDSRVIIGRDKELKGKDQRELKWGTDKSNDFVVEKVERFSGVTRFTLKHQNNSLSIEIPFTDDASIENAITCCAILVYLGYDEKFISQKMSSLHAIDMRLQLKHGINNCLIVNDSYSADLTSLRIALDFLNQQAAGLQPLVILSDFFESGKSREILYEEIAALLESYHIPSLIAIGEEISSALVLKERSFQYKTYSSTEEFLTHSKTSDFDHQIILVKGARKFGFERVAVWLEKKLHQTVLEINLNALIHNVKQYQRILNPQTRIMAMVKAFSYGSGGVEIASVLQFHNINFLGVAYADEGVELVKAGIQLPIMVMNAEESSFQFIVDNNLQPVIYSLSFLDLFEQYVKEQGLQAYPVHVEIETGMNRLGFSVSEVEELGSHLSESPFLKVISVFSHLAASEDPLQDEYTRRQSGLFNTAADVLQRHLSYDFLKHISNSAGIVMHPELQLDMVRLGIGLYGIEVDSKKALDLHPVASLRSTIAQVRKIAAGETVSYNRRGEISRDSLIGTVRVGYADGYSRQFSNGKGKMLVRGKLAPVVGTVCMDMTMIDLTGIEGVEEGDEVIVFGAELPVQTIASWIDTIPYEVMAGISQRVKRVYFHE